MNDTQETPRTGGTDDTFDAHRLRSITDMKRSKDDRLLGGVCAGAAKYLNVDPVIVRVIVAVLTFVGFAGVILYAAAWFLLPSEDADKSIAADWFRLDKNEEQVRVAGLVGAAVLAALAVVGDKGYAWWGVPWFLLPLAVLYYLFVVRPRRRTEERTAVVDPVVTTAPEGEEQTLVAPREPLVYPPTRKPRRSSALSILTLSVAAIAVASTRIYAEYHDATPWTTYVAIALGVLAVGLLVGTFFGHGGPLIALGILLAIALGIGSVLPSPRIGAQERVPLTASQVETEYEQGVGLLELDLTQVSDEDQLLGRTVKLTSGVGQTKIIVPRSLNVAVESDLDLGEIAVFDRKVNGTDNQLDYAATSTDPVLTLDIDQKVGNIEVIRR
jgi:phage shock protein PspC (stress-responsive transcriptional regulator)